MNMHMTHVRESNRNLLPVLLQERAILRAAAPHCLPGK
jgi:hypothetical protein